MRIFVDPIAYDCLNMGDMAMLQVAVRRLRQMWPGARIDVLTDAPDELVRLCPGVTPVSAEGHRIWFSDYDLLGRLHRLLPRPVSDLVVRSKDVLRRNTPRALQIVVSVKELLRGRRATQVSQFLDALCHADLVIASGAGGLSDACRYTTLSVLNTVAMAAALAKPVAMLSQNVGPLRAPDLRARAGKVLPQAGLISVREKRGAPALLHELGVPDEKVLVTGDDAIELAYHARPKGIGNAIGINLRVQRSSGVGMDLSDVIRPVFHEFAAERSATLVPLPSMRDRLQDARSIEGLLAGSVHAELVGDLDTPQAVLQQVARCRIVVTGAYHVAVFAMSQGIPAVCLAKSEYFHYKLGGLCEQFGNVCPVVTLEGSDLRERLGRAMNEAWESAEMLRAGLLSAACEQIALAQRAYHRLGGLVTAAPVPALLPLPAVA